MKSKFKILFVLLIVLIPYKTRALTGNLTISCSPNTAKANSVVKCVISGKTDEVITAVSSDISLSSNLTIESFEKSDKWEGDDVSNNKIDVYTSNDINSDFTIGTLNIKVKSGTVDTNEVVSLKSTIFYDLNDSENSIADVKATIRVPNNVCTLSALEVEGLNLKFNPDAVNYIATTTSDSINIVATPTDSKATVTGTGIKSLNDGKNSFDIVVTAEDGTTKTYNLDVTANIPSKNKIPSNDKDSSDDSNITNNNENSSSSSGDSNITNPKTGEISIIVVIILMAISAISVIYFRKKTEQN